MSILRSLRKTNELETSGNSSNIGVNFSGADLSALVRQAAILSLRKILLNTVPVEIEARRTVVTVGRENFEEALNNVRPSVSDQDRRRYEQLRTVFDIVR